MTSLLLAPPYYVDRRLRLNVHTSVSKAIVPALLVRLSNLPRTIEQGRLESDEHNQTLDDAQASRRSVS